jgi:peptide/nickel transport system permease protein
MSRYVLARMLEGLITLIAASLVIFFLVRLTGGNPAAIVLPENASHEEIKAMEKYLGLDKPLPEQYWKFITKLAQGDWGTSIAYRTPVLDLVRERIPVTLRLALAATVISLVFSIPAGVLAAVKRDRWQDTIAKGFAILGQSMPGFWLGILLIQIFAVWLGWLPAGTYGDGAITYWILPAACMGYHSAAGVLRITRSSMLDILNSDFVRLARIKGIPEKFVIWKHAFRNALIPVVTFGAVVYTTMLMGSVVTETIFAWPGLGRLAYEAISSRDYPVIQGVVILFVALFVVINLAIDILYCVADPRIRYEKK